MDSLTFDLPPELGAGKPLPSPPGVVADVLRLANDPTASVEDLTSTVERDPVLAGLVLGTVNSGLYTLAREILSVSEATVLMGFRAVRSLSLGLSVTHGMPIAGDCPSFSITRYWGHSLMVAVLGRELANSVNSSLAEDAFAIGLMANLGRLVIASGLPARYNTLLTEHPWPDHDQELTSLGFDHHQVGAGLLHHWGVPPSLCAATLYHHDPGLLPDTIEPAIRQATKITSAANQAVGGILTVTDEVVFEDLVEQLADAVGLTTSQTRETLMDAGRQVGQLEHMVADVTKSPEALVSRAEALFHRAAA